MRHDFFLLGIAERDELRRLYRPLYEHHVKPLAKENAALRAEMKRLCAVLNAALHPNGGGPESPALCDLVAFVKADMAALRARAAKAEAERDALQAWRGKILPVMGAVSREWKRQQNLFPELSRDGWMDLRIKELLSVPLRWPDADMGAAARDEEENT